MFSVWVFLWLSSSYFLTTTYYIYIITFSKGTNPWPLNQQGKSPCWWLCESVLELNANINMLTWPQWQCCIKSQRGHDSPLFPTIGVFYCLPPFPQQCFVNFSGYLCSTVSVTSLHNTIVQKWPCCLNFSLNITIWSTFRAKNLFLGRLSENMLSHSHFLMISFLLLSPAVIFSP